MEKTKKVIKTVEELNNIISNDIKEFEKDEYLNELITEYYILDSKFYDEEERFEIKRFFIDNNQSFSLKKIYDYYFDFNELNDYLNDYSKHEIKEFNSDEKKEILNSINQREIITQTYNHYIKKFDSGEIYSRKENGNNFEYDEVITLLESLNINEFKIDNDNIIDAEFNRLIKVIEFEKIKKSIKHIKNIKKFNAILIIEKEDNYFNFKDSEKILLQFEAPKLKFIDYKIILTNELAIEILELLKDDVYCSNRMIINLVLDKILNELELIKM